MNRVVISGIGVVSAAGSTVGEFWSALVEGRSAVRPLNNAATERVGSVKAAEVIDFDPAQHFDPKRLGLLDRFSQFAVCASREALRDSGLEMSEDLALGAAVIVGNAAGGQSSLGEAYFKLYGQNSPRLHPLTIPRWMVNAAGSQVSIDLGLKGPAWTVASACAAGTHAIGQAFHLLRNGQAQVALAGGSEACLTVGTIKAWQALRVLSQDTCRPFSKTRSGIVLGEGAAMLVLENYDNARRRGARIYAELLGFGMSADAHDITAPSVDGAVRAMNAALKDAKLNPGDIGYVNAHGTGTSLNDQTEAQALHLAFPGKIDEMPVSSSKGVLGHSLGAAGALEIAATALALNTQTIPPTANFEEFDPDCAIDCVPNVAREARIKNAMSNSFAFGGLNAVIVLGAS